MWFYKGKIYKELWCCVTHISRTLSMHFLLAIFLYHVGHVDIAHTWFHLWHLGIGLEYIWYKKEDLLRFDNIQLYNLHTLNLFCLSLLDQVGNSHIRLRQLFVQQHMNNNPHLLSLKTDHEYKTGNRLLHCHGWWILFGRQLGMCSVGKIGMKRWLGRLVLGTT